MPDKLQDRLTSTSAASYGHQSWEPEVFDLTKTDHQQRLEALLDSGEVIFAHDTIREQIEGLVETRHPAKEDPTEAEIKAWADEHLGGRDLSTYGVWVYYPWRKTLVHLLAEDEFRELRTSRNRNKITHDEQQKLRELKLGIVGLSVGQATAVTLALEEVGGTYRLADFDHLELSNMNRLRTGVHELGVHKAHITAREIFEINPFAKVEVYDRGISEENIDDFFLKGGKLDILYDECDGLAMKVRLREKARELQIPVLMETSDRGMIDIERFDLSPERPLFHGLVGELKADELHGLSTYEKVPTVMKIIGQRTMSHRMAASLVDVGTTLKTWPQLASAVALGGALNTDATRRICLGTLTASGRFYVDLEDIIASDAAHDVGTAPDYNIEISPEAATIVLPELPYLAGREPSVDDAKLMTAYAGMAPSGGNVQPWRITYSAEAKEFLCFHDRPRSKNMLDFEDTGTHIAFGALAENYKLVAAAMGLDCHIEPFPEAPNTDLIAKVRVEPDQHVHPDPLVAHVVTRCTNRKLGERMELPETTYEALSEAAASMEGHVHWLTDETALKEMGDLLGRGDRLRFTSKVMHQELMSEVRWDREEVERTRDGLDVATLELTPTDLAGMRLVSNWRVMSVAGLVGGGAGLEKPSRKSIAAASAVGLLTVQGTDVVDYFRGGRSLQRLWLTATDHELAFQPMTAITFLFTRLHAGGEDLSSSEQKHLAELETRFNRLFGFERSPETQIVLFRIAKANPPTARSLRRRVDDFLTVV